MRWYLAVRWRCPISRMSRFCGGTRLRVVSLSGEGIEVTGLAVIPLVSVRACAEWAGLDGSRTVTG